MKEDTARVKAVLEAVESDTKLMIQVNCAYEYYDAIKFAGTPHGRQNVHIYLVAALLKG